MVITNLGDALKLAKEAENKAQKLYQLVSEVSTTTYNQDEEVEKPEVTVFELFDQISFQQRKARFLRRLVAKTNVETITDFKFEDKFVSQAEAILLLSQLLGSKSTLERLANNRPKVRLNNMFRTNGITQWTEVTYDINIAKTRLSELEKNIRMLRTAIDKVNINTGLQIPDEYGDF